MNKKGGWGGWGPLIALGIIILMLVLFDSVLKDEFDLIPSKEAFVEGYGNAIGFEYAFSSSGEPELLYRPLKYIFGSIPQKLIDITGRGTVTTTPDNPVSAGLVIIALWIIMFLIFGDIMNIFGPFSKAVNWAVAFLFVIIGANIKFISYVAVYFLIIFSAFGGFAILLSLFVPIVIFILFHFGGLSIREWVVKRRMQDVAARAAAGGTKVAGAIEGLDKVADALKKIKGSF